jgi:hypothetical protein
MAVGVRSVGVVVCVCVCDVSVCAQVVGRRAFQSRDAAQNRNEPHHAIIFKIRTHTLCVWTCTVSIMERGRVSTLKVRT